MPPRPKGKRKTPISHRVKLVALFHAQQRKTGVSQKGFLESLSHHPDFIHAQDLIPSASSFSEWISKSAENEAALAQASLRGPPSIRKVNAEARLQYPKAMLLLRDELQQRQSISHFDTRTLKAMLVFCIRKVPVEQGVFERLEATKIGSGIGPGVMKTLKSLCEVTNSNDNSADTHGRVPSIDHMVAEERQEEKEEEKGQEQVDDSVSEFEARDTWDSDELEPTLAGEMIGKLREVRRTAQCVRRSVDDAFSWRSGPLASERLKQNKANWMKASRVSEAELEIFLRVLDRIEGGCTEKLHTELTLKGPPLDPGQSSIHRFFQRK